MLDFGGLIIGLVIVEVLTVLAIFIIPFILTKFILLSVTERKFSPYLIFKHLKQSFRQSLSLGLPFSVVFLILIFIFPVFLYFIFGGIIILISYLWKIRKFSSSEALPLIFSTIILTAIILLQFMGIFEPVHLFTKLLNIVGNP